MKPTSYRCLKKDNCIASSISLLTFLFCCQTANVARADVSPELQKAVLAEDWKTVADYAGQETSDKSSPVLRFLRGHACLALNMNNEAVRLFRDTGATEDTEKWRDWSQNFARIHPDSAIAACFAGDALARGGEHKQAIDAFNKGLRLSAKHALLLNARAVCFASMHKWNEALVDLEDAAAARGDLADIHANRGDLNVRRSLGAPGAFAAFDRALKISPNFVLAKIGQASALYGLGKWAEAGDLLSTCTSDSENGHLAAINAALVREAACDAEVASVLAQNPGTELTKSLSTLQDRAQMQNRLALAAEIGSGVSRAIGDTFNDFGKGLASLGQVGKGVTEMRNGKVLTGGATVSQGIGKLGNLVSDKLQENSDWAVKYHAGTVNQIIGLRSSSLQGGVSTEDLRRGFLDKGNWRMLARFALQYPEEISKNPTTAQGQLAP